MVHDLFDKKSAGSGVNMHTNNELLLDQLLENLKKEQVIQDLKTTFGVLI